ncbi:tetratricopeptide repeat protein [Chloroflexota bacterium]
MDATNLKDKLSEGLKAFEECRWQDAISLLEELYASNSSNVDIASKLGFALSQAREFDRSIEIFLHISSVQPERAVWPYSAGYQLYIQSHWIQAIEWFDKALNLNPDYIKALYRKGYAQLQAGRREEGLQTLQDCIKAWEKSSPEDRQTDRKYHAKANSALGKAYLSVGLSLKARRPLEKAVEFDGKDADKRYELGKCLLANRDADGAIEQLTKANSLKPGLDYVLDRLAQALIAKGDLNRAEETYKTIPEHRRRPYILKNMGELYLNLKQPQKAEFILKQALKRERNSHNIHYLLGRALEALEHKVPARQSYSKAIELREKNYGRDFPDARARIEQIDSELPDISVNPDYPAGDGNERGSIEYYNTQKGYGFIVSDSGKKVFFHVTNILGNILPTEGASVLFQYEYSPKGPKATKVDILTGE